MMKLLFILSIIAACHSSNTKKEALTSAYSTRVSGDSIIIVQLGKDFSIPLRGSLGSGYSWMLKDSLDKSSIELVSTQVTTDKQETAARPDVQQFTFRAKKTGDYAISFIYKRPWKKEPEAGNETKAFTIRIDPL